ncbi:MAG: hypothetical protein V3S69_01195 [Dehalococcoidales bacterium]
MTDLSYFQEPVEVLVTEEVGHMDEATQDWVVDSPAVYETQQKERKRPQQVSHSDLVRIIGKKINGDKLDAKIALQQEAVQWEWYDEYQEHLLCIPEINEWNAANAGTFLDEDEVEYTVEPKVPPMAPVRPPITTPAIWRTNNYTMLRQANYGTWQEQMEMLYDDQVNGTTKFKDAIAAVKTKHAKVGV